MIARTTPQLIKPETDQEADLSPSRSLPGSSGSPKETGFAHRRSR